jgi:hypothetical protein
MSPASDPGTGQWQTENVTTMEAMFAEATSFNQPIGQQWKTENAVKDEMFLGAEAMEEKKNQTNEVIFFVRSRSPCILRYKKKQKKMGPILSTKHNQPSCDHWRQTTRKTFFMCGFDESTSSVAVKRSHTRGHQVLFRTVQCFTQLPCRFQIPAPQHRFQPVHLGNFPVIL